MAKNKTISIDKSVVETSVGEVNLEMICANVEEFYQQEFWKLQEMDYHSNLPPELTGIMSRLLVKMREMTSVNDELEKYIQENYNKDFSNPAH